MINDKETEYLMMYKENYIDVCFFESIAHNPMEILRSIFQQFRFVNKFQRETIIRREPLNLQSLSVVPIYNRRDNDKNAEDITLIWLTNQEESLEERSLIESLYSFNDFIQICRNETELLTLLSSIVDEKVFLIVNYFNDSLLNSISLMKQIDVVFIYGQELPNITQERIIIQCSDSVSLVNRVRGEQILLKKQIATFSIYNQAEKATRDLTRESGSFLFFQLFKFVLTNMIMDENARRMMLSKCRDYYRGNTKELNNIDDFERNYKSSDAIVWYTKDAFVYRLINKALRTEDAEALYHFRFYITDLSKQLKKNYVDFKNKLTTNTLHVYRGFKAAPEEVASFKKNIGNLISVNGFLSTSRVRQVAYDFATKPNKRQNVQRVLFEYIIDLSCAKKIIVADIAKYSKFPDEAEMLFDIGASFQIDSCTYDASDNLWLIRASGTDKGADLASEYIQYQRAKIAESNIDLMFGHLLIETGQYEKAEKYFEAFLCSSNPNDEEIACIYHNIGRAYRLKAEYERAIIILYLSYETHLNARPPRFVSAARTINTIGIVYMEQSDFDRAEQSFGKALQLLRRTVHRNHVDIGGTLNNFANLYCQEGNFEKALTFITQAQKIFKHSLPSNHPNIAAVINNLGILYYRQKRYDLAFDTFKQALALKEKVLPIGHLDLARVEHNLALVCALLHKYDQAESFFTRALQCNLPTSHPFMIKLEKNSKKCRLARELEVPIEKVDIDETEDYFIIHF